MALADQKAGFAARLCEPRVLREPAARSTDVLSVKTAVARRNFVNGVDATAGTVGRAPDVRRLLGLALAAHGPGWDNVTGLGVPNGIFSP